MRALVGLLPRTVVKGKARLTAKAFATDICTLLNCTFSNTYLPGAANTIFIWICFGYHHFEEDLHFTTILRARHNSTLLLTAGSGEISLVMIVADCDENQLDCMVLNSDAR